MKKLTFILYICLLMAVLVGCETVLTSKMYRINDDVQKIKISDISSEVNIFKSNEDYSFITYGESEKYICVFDYDSESKTLNIKREDKRGVFKNEIQSKITIYINSSLDTDIEIKLTKGNIQVEETNINNLIIETQQGNISITNSTIDGLLDVKNNRGDITLSDSSVKDINIDILTSTLTFNNFNSNGLIKGMAESVDIKGTSIKFNQFDFEATRLDIDLYKLDLDSFKAKTETGSINLRLTQNESMFNTQLNSKLGSIRGSHKGGNKQINIETTSGDIFISYNN